MKKGARIVTNKDVCDRHGTPLWQKPWLSRREVMKLMCCGQDALTEKVESGAWTEVKSSKKRTKISTDSIRRDLDREADALRTALVA